jgi:transcriptional regulator with XRE-family HTH domain
MMDMLFDYSKLRGRIVEKFGTMSAFADYIGISEVALSRKLNNKIAISREDMIAWSKALDVSLNEYGAFYFAQKLNEV